MPTHARVCLCTHVCARTPVLDVTLVVSAPVESPLVRLTVFNGAS